jgi:hypothetical protein
MRRNHSKKSKSDEVWNSFISTTARNPFQDLVDVDGDHETERIFFIFIFLFLGPPSRASPESESE